MKLQRKSLEWALNYLHQFSDTDLFPRLIEIDVLKSIETDTINALENIDLGNYSFGSARRFPIPKDEISYRIATQLNPIDTIFLTAIVYEYGSRIENRRISVRSRCFCRVYCCCKRTIAIINCDRAAFVGYIAAVNAPLQSLTAIANLVGCVAAVNAPLQSLTAIAPHLHFSDAGVNLLN